MFDEVKAVGNLHGLRCPSAYPTGVFPGPTPGDNRNAGVRAKPRGGGLGPAVGAHGDDGMGLVINQDRAIDLAFVKRDVVAAQDARGGL